MNFLFAHSFWFCAFLLFCLICRWICFFFRIVDKKDLKRITQLLSGIVRFLWIAWRFVCRIIDEVRQNCREKWTNIRSSSLFHRRRHRCFEFCFICSFLFSPKIRNDLFVWLFCLAVCSSISFRFVGRLTIYEFLANTCRQLFICCSN